MKSIFRSMSGALICGLLVQSAWAAGSGEDQAGQFPMVAGNGSLTIAGQGHWFQKEYKGGDAPSISAYDNLGNVLPDGMYRYEFRSLPQGNGARHDNLEGMEEKRLSRGKTRAKTVNTLSGRFAVQGGEVIFR